MATAGLACTIRGTRALQELTQLLSNAEKEERKHLKAGMLGARPEWIHPAPVGLHNPCYALRPACC